MPLPPSGSGSVQLSARADGKDTALSATGTFSDNVLTLSALQAGYGLYHLTGTADVNVVSKAFHANVMTNPARHPRRLPGIRP